MARGVDQLQEGQVVDLAHPVVVFAEGGGDVDYAGALVQGDVVVGHHPVALLAVELGAHVEEGLILRAHESGPGEGLHDLHVLPQHVLHQRFGQDEHAVLPAGLHVHFVGVDAQGHVAGQRPGGGGPGEDAGAAAVLQIELRHGGGLLHVLVALGHLVGGEGRPAAGAVGHDLVALVEESLVVDGLESPPLGLDVVVVIGHVGIVHVHPVTHPVGHVRPLGGIFPHGLLAALDEGLHAVFFDLLLAVQAQLLLHLQLHGQAVGVPAGLPKHVVALHGPVAGDDVLDAPGQHVADVGLAVGRGRAVEHGVGGGALPKLHALLKHLVFLPEGQDRFLPVHELQIRRYFVVHTLLQCFFENKRSPVPV